MKKIVLATIAMGALAAPAMASGYNCGNVPQDQWMSKDEVRTRMTDQGYEVRQVKVEDGCYEVYALKDGRRLEALLNPATGEMIGSESGEMDD